jgi:hypothetical protein
MTTAEKAWAATKLRALLNVIAMCIAAEAAELDRLARELRGW